MWVRFPVALNNSRIMLAEPKLSVQPLISPDLVEICRTIWSSFYRICSLRAYTVGPYRTKLRWVLMMRMLWGYVMSLILLWNGLGKTEITRAVSGQYCRSLLIMWNGMVGLMEMIICARIVIYLFISYRVCIYVTYNIFCCSDENKWNEMKMK